MATSDVWPNGMPEVGQTGSRSRKVTAHDIELFTEISGDRNPPRFGVLVAHGSDHQIAARQAHDRMNR